MTFGRAILGDNQFLGVNHASPIKATEMNDRFSNPDAILEVLGWAYDSGVRHFMFTTHDRLAPVLMEIAQSNLFPEMRYIPCLPYAHKYANTMTEGGMGAVLTRHVKGASKRRIAAFGGRLVVGDWPVIIEGLLEIELLMTRGLRVEGVFLQNVVFDLMLGFRANGFIERFHQTVCDRYKAVPGYITMNHPLAQKVLSQELGIVKPWICANFNSIGFRTHPSHQEVEASFRNGASSNIAMSVFASGIIDYQAAMNYVAKYPGVDAILFGSSNRRNIERNVNLILGSSPEGIACAARN